MGSTLQVIGDHAVPKGSALAQSEHQLAEAMTSEFESFYKQGVILERIKDKGEYRDANYTSFDEYMDKRMPLGIRKSHAWRLIAAKSIRPLLPDISDTNSPFGESQIWTEGKLRPLTNKKFSPSDVRRLGKKIATQVKHGAVLSAVLVKQICDEDLGVVRKRKEKKDRLVSSTKTAAEHIRQMEKEIRLWKSSLEKVPASFWEEADAEDRGCYIRLSKALSDLASFLRS
jgi:hypothetical protein